MQLIWGKGNMCSNYLAKSFHVILPKEGNIGKQVTENGLKRSATNLQTDMYFCKFHVDDKCLLLQHVTDDIINGV